MIGGWATYYGSDAIRWWPDIDGTEFDGAEDTPRHQRVIPAAYLVWMRNQARRAQWFYYARQYGGFEQVAAMPLGGLDPSAQSFDPGTMPYNVMRSGTNTLTAKVIKNRPSPFYMPVDGDYRLHQRVRRLNRFVVGLFHHLGYYKARHFRVRNAGLFGTGQLLIQKDGRRVSVEPLLPWEVYVDPVDARQNDPRCLYLIRYLDKGKLKARFPKHKEAIEAAPVLDESFQPVADTFAVSNRCTVVECWHLPSGEITWKDEKGEQHTAVTKDGRHSICLLDETLLDEPYKHFDYPINNLVKDPAIAGWWGMGLGDELSGFQDRIATMDERLEYAHRIVGGQIWLVPEGCQVYDADFNDDIGVVVRVTAGLVEQIKNVNPEPVHEYTYDYFRNLIPDAYGFSGISTMSAQSQKPAGVTAALALQTLDDIETDRFIGFERDDEEAVVADTRLMLRAVREIADEYGDFEIMSAGRGSGEKILWKRDVDLKEDSYVVQGWAISLLPKTPAAKFQRVLELGANGYFDKPEVLRALELPDTTREENLMLSSRDVCDAQITAMLSHENPDSPEAYIPPSEHQDCQYALSRADSYYNYMYAEQIDKGTYNDPANKARLRNLDTYMKAAEAINEKARQQALAQAQQAAAMQAQAQQQAGGNAAGAAPGPAAQPQPVGQPISPQAPVAPATPLAA